MITVKGANGEYYTYDHKSVLIRKETYDKIKQFAKDSDRTLLSFFDHMVKDYERRAKRRKK